MQAELYGYNHPVREVFKEITDEQWRGDEPYFEGGEWLLNGEMQQGQGYSCYFGTGEIAFGQLAKGEIAVGADVVFCLHGIVKPHLRCRDGDRVFDSETDAGALFEKHFNKYLSKEPFKSKFGELFVLQIKRAIDYTFEV